MIQSNVIINKNAANKVYEAFKGVVGARTVLPINSKFGSIIEITVFVDSPAANTRVHFTRAGAFSTEVNVPTLLDSNGERVVNNTFVAATAGLFTFYADIKSYTGLTIAVYRTDENAGANISVSYALFSEKFTALEYLENKRLAATGGIGGAQYMRISGTTATGVIVYKKLPTKRFLFLAADLYSTGSALSHYFVRIIIKSGATVYPASIDVNTGEQVSYGNGQVSLSRARDTYIDLYQYDAAEVLVGRTLNAPELNAIVYSKGFADVLPSANNASGGGTDDVLIEGENYRFVRKATFSDAWDGQFVQHFSNGVYLSDDLATPRKQQISAASAVAAEDGSGVSRARLIPYDPAKKNTTAATRINITMGTGAVYHNFADGGGIGDWAKTKFWEMRGTNRKIPVATLGEVDDLHRFDPTLPPERYARNATKTEAGHTFIEYQEKPNFSYLGPLCRTKKMVLWGSYLVTGERIGVWMTTDGGANYVLIYDFIDGLALLPNPVNTSTFAAYSGGLTLKKVNITYPSAANKEPTDVFSYTDVAFSAITTGAETEISATAHGLSTGDIVLLTGTAQDQNWHALTCDEFTANGFKQNVYSVVKLTDDTFKLATYIGSYDTPLRCRHVHSINEHIGGAIVSTGEEHPNGWFLYITQKFKDGSTVVDAFDFPKSRVYRLNSAKNGIQRACGLIMDNASDPNIIFNCDTSNISLGNYHVEGRTTGMPPVSCNGIWRGKLSDIDDWTKFECIVDIPEPAIWMYQWGKVILGYYQLGGMVISLDNGATWEYIPKGTSIFSGVFNDKIAIGNGYVFEWKK